MPRPIKISVIGAGSAQFSLGLVKDLCLTPGLAACQVSFMDIDPERLDVIHGTARRYASELGAGLRFEKTLDRQESLRDADVVVNTAYALGHGHARRVREATASHGYYYGGLDFTDFHNFNVMMAVARDIERICPDAWLIQSGNPVFEGCTLMTRETGVKVCGLCHGHFGWMQVAATLGLDPERVTWEAPGLNHCIWLTRFLYEGENAYPLLDRWIEAEGEEYWRTHRATRTHDIQMSRGTLHQYKMYGLMPIGDTPRESNVRENWWYHTDLATKKRWFGEPFGGPDTEVARPLFVANLEQAMRQIAAAAADPAARLTEVFGATKSREQHAGIIDGLVNNVEGRFQVNIPNRGTIQGLPDDVVIETQALIDATGIHAIKPTPLPRKVMLEQVMPRWLRMEQELEAYRSGDAGMLLWTALQSHQTRRYDQAVAVLQELLAMPEHADLREHVRGFDGTGPRWSAAPQPSRQSLAP